MAAASPYSAVTTSARSSSGARAGSRTMSRCGAPAEARRRATRPPSRPVEPVVAIRVMPSRTTTCAHFFPWPTAAQSGEGAPAPRSPRREDSMSFRARLCSGHWLDTLVRRAATPPAGPTATRRPLAPRRVEGGRRAGTPGPSPDPRRRHLKASKNGKLRPPSNAVPTVPRQDAGPRPHRV